MKISKTKNNLISLSLPYHLNSAAKQIPGYAWSRKARLWYYPQSSLLDLVDYFPDHQLSDDVCQIYDDLLEKQRLLQELKLGKGVPEDFHSDLYDHQRQAIMMLGLFDYFGLFLGIGSGKTAILLRFLQDHPEYKTLVVCPLSIIESAWLEDAERWSPELRVFSLYGKNKKKREEALHRFYLHKGQVGVINFDGFKIMLSQLKDFNTLVIDESTKIKGNNTKITKTLTKYGLSMKRRYIMTGSPTPQSELDLFSQVRFLDASILGKNFSAFRNRYFMPVARFQHIVTKWSLRPGQKKNLLNRVKRNSFTKTTDECVQLPDQIFLTREFNLDKKNTTAYVVMQRDMTFQDMNVVNVLAKTMKMRQLSSGFILGTDCAYNISKEKLNVLKDILEEIGKEQVIILYQFKEELKLLSKVVDNYSQLHGGIPGDKRGEEIRKFKNGETQVLLGQATAMAHGLTFVNCNYMVFFSLPWSLEIHEQACGRIYRTGQRKKTIYYTILSRLEGGQKTIDWKINNSLREKKLSMHTVLKILKG